MKKKDIETIMKFIKYLDEMGLHNSGDVYLIAKDYFRK